MMDFGLPTFTKSLSSSVNIQDRINTSFPLIRLNNPEKFELRIGKRVVAKDINKDGEYPVYSANVKEPFGYIDKVLFDDFERDSILWGIDGDWMVGYLKKGIKFYPTDHCGVLRILTIDIIPYYVALALEIVGEKYGFSRSFRASTERIEAVQIPFPPLSIQQQIVKECEAIDEEYNTSRMTIETYRNKISDIFDRLEVVTKSNRGGVIQISNICEFATARIAFSSIDKASYVSTDNLLQNCEGMVEYDGYPTTDTVVEYRKGDILLSNIRPYLKKLWLADQDGGCSPDVLVIRVKDERINPEFLYYSLRRQQFFDFIMTDIKGMKMPRGNKNHILRFEIPYIDKKEQISIVEKVREYETIISDANNVMQSCSQRKKDVLLGYIR